MIYKLTNECWWGDHLQQIDVLMGDGIKAAICVAHDSDISFARYMLPYFTVAMADNTRFEQWQIEAPLGLMTMCLRLSLTPFLVYCRAGLSRSAAFAALWLTWREHMSYDDALARVRSLCANACMHDIVWQQLRCYSESERYQQVFTTCNEQCS